MARLPTLRKIDWFLGLPLAVALAAFCGLSGLASRKRPSPKTASRIAVIKLLGGGNFALGMPLLLGLRRTFPNARLLAIVTPSTSHFAEISGVFDELVIIDTKSLCSLLVSGLRALFKVFRTDVVVDLEIHSKLTTCFAVFSAAKNTVGFFSNDFFVRKYLYSHLVFFNPSASRVDLFNQLLILLGGRAATRQECHAHMTHNLKLNGPSAGMVAIGIGCSELGTERKLTPAHWKKVLSSALVREKADTVLFLGTASDHSEADEIISWLNDRLPNIKFNNLCGSIPLRKSIQLLANCSFFWGIDSALLHYARLFKVPSESFWGPTNPSTRLSVLPELREIVHYKPIICSPCIHVAETAPCEGRNLCIRALFEEENITPEIALANTSFSCGGNMNE